MQNKQLPLQIPGINENIYADFLIRLGAGLLDGLFLVPITLLTLFADSFGSAAFYGIFALNMVVSLWYFVYRVQKYGGTPGKIICGIHILKINGDAITWKEAFLRHIVGFTISIVAFGLSIYSRAYIDMDAYNELDWMQKQQVLHDAAPSAHTIFSWLTNIWFLSELVTFIVDKRNRAAHDYIAGTVAVKTQYLNEIQKAMDNSPESNDTQTEN